MGRIFLVVMLGAGLFMGGIWYSGLLSEFKNPTTYDDDQHGPGQPKVAALTTLGADLFAAAKFPHIPNLPRPAIDPTVLHGTLNPIEQEEVPSLVNGRVLFIGEQVDDAAVLAAGSTAFVAEPYYSATIHAGNDKFVKFYRRIYEGETIRQNQMLAMIEPAEALGEVLVRIAKVNGAIAEHEASVQGELEGRVRYVRAIKLWEAGAMSDEEFGSHKLTYFKLKYEKDSKYHLLQVAEEEKKQADIKLRMHEIRAVLPYKLATVKTILRQRGYAVKQLDPVMIVQNLEKLMAEAQIEEQYFTHLRDRPHVTATIEPMILEKPVYEFPGHARDVTSVAVSKDRKIVSASEDQSVRVWSTTSLAPLRTLEHDAPVRVVVCSPDAAEKNLCIAGCTDGAIYLWDLDAKDAAPIKIEKAHGNDVAVTSLAFSPDGAVFASGASDGSITIRSSADGKTRYGFVPENGVAAAHDDAVTSLHFTPQCKLVSAGRDKTLRVWTLKENGAAAEGKPVRHREGNVPNLGVSRDGKWMLFDLGKTLQLLSVQTHELKQTLTVPQNSTPFETLAIFSPDSSLILTAGAPDGRLQLWRTPDSGARAFEVRQFAARDRLPVACAAFSPDAGKGGPNSFAVSASGQKIYVWPIPTSKEVSEHRIERVRMTLKTHALDPSTRHTRIGFEVQNPVSERYPNGRFEAGRPVTIVIE
ncbi:MAG: hypothetical protein HYX68_01375 [Planctomycetes bacterium]|nr:hypothetical protein [Planctomycetota bacterium]